MYDSTNSRENSARCKRSSLSKSAIFRCCSDTVVREMLAVVNQHIDRHHDSTRIDTHDVAGSHDIVPGRFSTMKALEITIRLHVYCFTVVVR